MKEWIETCGINGVVLGATTIDSVETGLSILLLSITIVWTTLKISRLLKDKE